MSAPGLEARVGVRAGGFALDASVSCAPGEVLAVLGPNGAGKTTLLRVLAGLQRLDLGSVRLEARVLEDTSVGLRLPPEERSVAMVHQDLLLFPHLSVLANVAFGPRARRRSRAEANRVAARWLERMGLAELAPRRPHELSGGQAQQVALARALATEPDLLLLDEPMSSLDVAARLDARRRLGQHLRAFAGPCVLVTHDPLEALTLGDRLAVLEAGRITQVGSPAEVTRRPRSPWAAQLVGLNLYRGRAHDGRVDVGGAALHVAAGSVHGEVFAVVHPRAVALHRRKPEGSPRNVWQAEVAGIDTLGDRVRVHLSGVLPITAEVTAASVADLELGAGGTVWVSVKATEVDTYPA